MAAALALIAFALGTGPALACVPMPGDPFFQVENIEDHVVGSPRLSDIERAFLKVPDNNSARSNLRTIASKPHVAGTPGDLETAEFVRDQLRSYGIPEVSIEEVPATLAYPVDRSLQLLSPDKTRVIFEANLSEPILEQDRTSDTWWRNHTFGGYSPSGNVTAELVYANFGLPEDFDTLEKQGVNVSGKIVITRYGQCFRGLKAMNAEKRGAIGVLIYSDPEQDGYAQGKAFPEGPWRPKESVQRGSMQFLSLCAGDPGRPYLPKGSEPVCGFEESDLIPGIPVLPISYGDAMPILESLDGPQAPEGFVGALNLTKGYHLGPSPLPIRLHVHNRFTTTPIWNVIAKIPGIPGDSSSGDGSERPVVIGNHRDAWVYGAADPNSGTAQMMEVARGFGALLKQGWKPKRPIYICSWDGEEYGLLGSTAWGELHKDMLSTAVAYLNVDTGVSGTKFTTGATPSLGSALMGVLRDVTDPKTGDPLVSRFDGVLGTLGSGSDYTVFLDHLGVPSIDMRFSPESGAPYGVYHSVYDSFDWMDKEGDPGFHYHVAMAQVWGLLCLRLTEPEILPFNHTLQAVAMESYVHSIEHSAKEENVTDIDLTPLHVAVHAFADAARSVGQSSSSSSSSLNDRLAFTERRFLSREGLPGRQWFKHVLQAPGLYKGYGSDVFPAVMEAIRDHKPSLAQLQIQTAAERVTDAAAFLLGQ